jgi:hypothetical protein
MVRKRVLIVDHVPQLALCRVHCRPDGPCTAFAPVEHAAALLERMSTPAGLEQEPDGSLVQEQQLLAAPEVLQRKAEAEM